MKKLDHDNFENGCQQCDVSRRDFLKYGIGGFLGYVLANQLQPIFAAPGAGLISPWMAPTQAKAVIVLWMAGGPSQLDTFDPKPGTSTGGPFKAIDTAAKGIQISEHLPNVAKQMKHISLVRGMTSREGNHQRASYLLHTGYPPMGTVNHPSFGSIVSAEIGPKDFDLPNYISIGGPSIGAGFLGVTYNPYLITNPNQPPDNLNPQYGLGKGRLEGRLKLLDMQEKDFGKTHTSPEEEGHQEIYKKSVKMMNSSLVKAFDLTQEKADVRDRYGRNNFGQGCLLARRLVETGVKYVEVNLNGWDTHKDNFDQTKKLMGSLDPGYATLIEDLAGRNMLKDTLVIWMGEFGRTPKVNGNDGRDHFPKAYTVALAGGGIHGGRVVGETNDDGTDIKSRPVAVPDLFATLANNLGINPDKANVTPQGRPIRLVDKSAKIVEELVS